MDTTKPLDGKTALVTGAAMGIGRACALEFARQGARVVVADIADEAGGKVVEEIEALGGQAIYSHCDVSQEEQIRAMVAAGVEAFGRLDFACNNAGIGGPSAPTGDYPLDGWNRVIAINLTGAFLCMKYEIPEMLRQGGGSIVNMASILGKVGFAGAPAYVAAKHGLIGLTQTAALDYAQQGIRVNAVCPGFIYTPLIEQAGMQEGTEAHRAIAGLHAMNRMGTVEEVAGLVVFLCTPSASFMTGDAILVDGGYTAR